jgi:general secretion pathway protein G
LKTTNHRTTGFTLIELIVTIAIITLLAGILIPTVGTYTDKSKKTKAAAELRILADAFTSYQTDCSAWPANWDAVQVPNTDFPITAMPCMYKNVFNKTGWDGPYLAKGVMINGAMNINDPNNISGGGGLTDPWGNPYYCFMFQNGWNNTTGALMLLSRGKNGQLETGGDQIYGAKAGGDDIIQIVSYKP